MRIKIIKDKSNWQYFWTKTIKGVDLENHCANTFIGKYLNGDNIYTEEKNVYICGVSKPFNYNKNLHVALKENIGHTETINEKGVTITIYDAIRVGIKPLNAGESFNSNRNKKSFYSCRNWQYGNQLANE